MGFCKKIWDHALMFEIWEKMIFFANKVIKENWDFGNKIQPDPVQCQENCNCWTTVGQLLDNWDNWDTGPRSMPGPPSEGQRRIVKLCRRIVKLPERIVQLGLWNLTVGLWNFPSGLCNLDCETWQSDCETSRADCTTWIVKLEKRIVKL